MRSYEKVPRKCFIFNNPMGRENKKKRKERNGSQTNVQADDEFLRDFIFIKY